MSSYIISVITQILALFIFVFDPTELNIGKSITNLPDWAIKLAQMGGNSIWIWGALLFIVSMTFLVLSITNDKSSLREVVATAIKKGNGPKNKFFNTILLYTSIIVGFVGLGSGFWFTGFFWLVALWSMIEYRQLYWIAIKQKLDPLSVDTHGNKNDAIDGTCKDVSNNDHWFDFDDD